MPTSNDLVLIRSQLLTDIANAIRTKTGGEALIYPADMDTEILSIDTEAHLPITVNITQSAHQTITVTPAVTGLTITNGQITVPTSVRLTATIAPDTGYAAGTLNHSSVTAAWGDTVSFSATSATERNGALRVAMSTTATMPDLREHVSVTYTFTAIGGSTSAQTFTNEATNSQFTISALAENQVATYVDTFIVTEGDILQGYLDCDTLSSSGSFTKSGSFEIETAAPNGSLSVTIWNVDYIDPLEVGSEITYDIEVTNNGNLTLYQIEIGSEIADDVWPIDDLAPGQSQSNLTSSYTLTTNNVERGYVVLDAYANALSPDPDNPDVNVTTTERVDIGYVAFIYFEPEYNSGEVTEFNESDMLSTQAETALNNIATAMNLPTGDSYLKKIYLGSSYVRSINPVGYISVDDFTGNESAYGIHFGGDTPTELTNCGVYNAAITDIIPGYGSISINNNRSVNLSGLISTINTNQIDVSNGIFLVLKG